MRAPCLLAFLSLLCVFEGRSQNRYFYNGNIELGEDISTSMRLAVWAESNSTLSCWFQVYQNDSFIFETEPKNIEVRAGNKYSVKEDRDAGIKGNSLSVYQVKAHVSDGNDTTLLESEFVCRGNFFPLRFITADFPQAVWKTKNFSITNHSSLPCTIGVLNKTITAGPGENSKVPLHFKESYHISLQFHDHVLHDTVLSLKELYSLGSVGPSLIASGARLAPLDSTWKDYAKCQQLPSIASRPSGSIGVDIKASSLDSVFEGVPNNYIRYFASPRWQVMGVPLKADFFYSTESGYGYDLNSFSLGLDVRQLQEKAASKNQSILDSLANSQWNNQIAAKELEKRHQLNDVLTTRFQNEFDSILEHSKSQLDSTQLDELRGGNEFSESLIRDSIDHSLSEVRGKVLSSKLNDLQDSLSKAKDHREKLNSRLDSLNRDYRDAHESAADIRKKIETKDFGTTEDMVGWLSHIKTLQVGRHRTSYLPGVAEGLNLNGMSFGVLKNDLFFKVSSASINNATGIFSNQSFGAFDKNLKALRIGKGGEDQQHLHLVLIEQGEKVEGASKGIMSAVSTKKHLSKSIDVSLVLGKSTVENGNRFYNIGEHVRSIQVMGQNHFVRSDLQINLGENLLLEGLYQDIGENFNTSLSPFVFAGRTSYKLGINGRMSSLFQYKLGYSLEQGNIGFKNSVSGLNLEARLSPKRLPSIQLAYIPFRQAIDILGDEQVLRNDYSTLNISAFKELKLNSKNRVFMQATYMNFKYGLTNTTEVQNLENFLLSTQLNISDSKYTLNSSLGHTKVKSLGGNNVWNLDLNMRLTPHWNCSGSLSKTFSPLQNSTQNSTSFTLRFSPGKLRARAVLGRGNFINHPYLGTTDEWYVQVGVSYSL